MFMGGAWENTKLAILDVKSILKDPNILYG